MGIGDWINSGLLDYFHGIWICTIIWIDYISFDYRPEVKPLYELAFLKRPADELYDLAKDPYQMNNVASDVGYAEIKRQLSNTLTKYLKKTGDPRIIGGKIIWDTQKYHGSDVARPRKEAIEKFNLKREYNFMEK